MKYLRLNASSSAYGDMISQGGQVTLSGHMSAHSQQSFTNSGQLNSSVFQSTAPSREGRDPR